MGAKISKGSHPTLMTLFQLNYFYMFIVTVLAKATYRNFKKLNFIFFKRLKLNIVANGKFQNATPRIVMILFLYFPCDSPQNVTYWDFQISYLFFVGKKIEIFVNMDPYGSENVKTLLLLQL